MFLVNRIVTSCHLFTGSHPDCSIGVYRTSEKTPIDARQGRGGGYIPEFYEYLMKYRFVSPPPGLPLGEKGEEFCEDNFSCRIQNESAFKFIFNTAFPEAPSAIFRIVCFCGRLYQSLQLFRTIGESFKIFHYSYIFYYNTKGC
jgi:hypothetical protein